MSPELGVMVFARHDSSRVPGKALRLIGGIPLLERVIRRAQLLPWPVYLATTDKPSDDALVAVASGLDVPSFRGSEDRVLERAVLAAEAFELSAFARLCGDRPLFPLDTMDRALETMHDNDRPLDLVTSHPAAPTGLTTEVARTATLRRILDAGPTPGQQEHVTLYMYEHPEEFHIVRIPSQPTEYSCPGFAVDTESDLARLNSIVEQDNRLDLSPARADRIYRA